MYFISIIRLFKYINNFTTENWKFLDKDSDSDNDYQQFMIFSRNKKNNVYHCKPQFYYIKVGLKGVKII